MTADEHEPKPANAEGPEVGWRPADDPDGFTRDDVFIRDPLLHYMLAHLTGR